MILIFTSSHSSPQPRLNSPYYRAPGIGGAGSGGAPPRGGEEEAQGGGLFSKLKNIFTGDESREEPIAGRRPISPPGAVGSYPRPGGASFAPRDNNFAPRPPPPPSSIDGPYGSRDGSRDGSRGGLDYPGPALGPHPSASLDQLPPQTPPAPLDGPFGGASRPVPPPPFGAPGSGGPSYDPFRPQQQQQQGYADQGYAAGYPRQDSPGGGLSARPPQSQGAYGGGYDLPLPYEPLPEPPLAASEPEPPQVPPEPQVFVWEDSVVMILKPREFFRYSVPFTYLLSDLV